MSSSIQTPFPSGGQRQYLTVLFSDLKGSTLLGRTLEVERFAELLDLVRRAWHAAAERHHGTVLRIQGDGALIVFGYPQSGEEDARHAVDSALEIHDAVRRIGHEHLGTEGDLSVRSGIHAGVVLLTEGDLERGRLDLSGDVANVAAHLQRDAPDDGILVSLDALGPHANLYDWLPDPRREPDHVKVVQVRARGKAQRRFDATAQRGLTPFIGRDPAIARLLEHLAFDDDAARSDCVVVQAAAGMGKTRLLEEFVQRCVPAGWQALRGYCDPPARSEPLQPFAQMMRGEGAIADADAALPSLRRVCARGPTLLVVDDWQWADDASRQLLVAMMRGRRGPRVLLAARAREDGAPWIADAPHLMLPSFDAAQTEHAVRRLLPDADPFLAQRIHDYAGGVPLYVEELCRSAAVETLATHAADRRGAAGWLGALVASRLGRLEPRHAAIVRAAAVIGNLVPVELLQSVVDTVLDAETLAHLADADFLYPVGSTNESDRAVRFKHGITRDAVYETIGLYERTSLHQRIEATLLMRLTEARGPAAEITEALAHHARGAGHWDLAATFAERAGDAAVAVYAMDSARRQYRAALEAVEHLPARGQQGDARWCALGAKLGMTCVWDPLSLPDGLATFERAVMLSRGLDDKGIHVRACYWHGYVLYALGRFPEAAGQLRAALDVAREVNYTRLAAQLEATLGQVLAAASEYPAALALMTQAVDFKSRTSRGAGNLAIGSAYTLACKGGVHADQGDFDAAAAAFDVALELLAESTHPVRNSTLNWIAITAVLRGRWDEAQRVATDSVAIATGTRVLLLLAISRGVLGYARWCAGVTAGLDELRESVRWMKARQCDFYASLFHGWLIEALIGCDASAPGAAGDRAELARAARMVLGRSRQGERLGEAVACRALAWRAACSGRAQVAQRWMRRAEHSAQIRQSGREAALNQLMRAAIDSTPPAGRRAAAATVAAPANTTTAAARPSIPIPAADSAAAALARLRDLGVEALPRLYASLAAMAS